MTKARPIFMRRGCLFTTLAAALLLATSAGTASAQPPRIGFTPVSGSVNEGATANTDSEHPLSESDRQGVGSARGTGRRGRGRSAYRAPASHRCARRDHH